MTLLALPRATAARLVGRTATGAACGLRESSPLLADCPVETRGAVVFSPRAALARHASTACPFAGSARRLLLTSVQRRGGRDSKNSRWDASTRRSQRSADGPAHPPLTRHDVSCSSHARLEVGWRADGPRNQPVQGLKSGKLKRGDSCLLNFGRLESRHLWAGWRHELAVFLSCSRDLPSWQIAKIVHI